MRLRYGDRLSPPIDATVLDHQLLGNIIRYSVDTAIGQITADLLNRSSERMLEQGAFYFPNIFFLLNRS